MIEKGKASQTTRVIVMGLGYVGLPLTVAFAKAGLEVIGFDVDSGKIQLLKKGIDPNGELSAPELKATGILWSNQPYWLRKADFIIVAVPTPVGKAKQPDLTSLRLASQLIGKNLKRGTIVVFESTVYPGATEEFCLPLIEQFSNLKCGRDWKIGYSPERINPGDKAHTLDKVVKVVAGMDKSTLLAISRLYQKICKAGLCPVSSIRVAELAKVIENAQRDLNIALVNEVALLCHRLGIETREVLQAARTKWNFLPFQPGLVGGHCLGVDPYYLIYKAQELGYHPQLISAGRRINDSMGKFVAEEVIKGLTQAGKSILKARVLVLGLTYKENISDTRNSKIADTIKALKDLGAKVIGYDPYLTQQRIEKEFGVKAVTKLNGQYDAVVIGTAHDSFQGLENAILSLMPNCPVVMDVRSMFPSFKKHRGVIYKSL